LTVKHLFLSFWLIFCPLDPDPKHWINLLDCSYSGVLYTFLKYDSLPLNLFNCDDRYVLECFFTGVNKKSFPDGENNFLKYISLILILVQTFLELTIKLVILLLQHDIDLGQGLCELEISYDLLLDFTFFHMQELWPFFPIWTIYQT